MRIVKKFVTAHADLDGEIRMRIVRKFRDCACGLRSRRAKCSAQIVEVALLFYSTCLTVECLLVGHDTGVIDAGKKLPIFFQARLGMILR